MEYSTPQWTRRELSPLGGLLYLGRQTGNRQPSLHHCEEAWEKGRLSNFHSPFDLLYLEGDITIEIATHLVYHFHLNLALSNNSRGIPHHRKGNLGRMIVYSGIAGYFSTCVCAGMPDKLGNYRNLERSRAVLGA